jgi:hypothetical protein
MMLAISQESVEVPADESPTRHFDGRRPSLDLEMQLADCLS